MALPRALRLGLIMRAAMPNTLRVAVSYPSRYASSRSRTVRYHWCRRPATYPVPAVRVASSVIRTASFPGAVMVQFLPSSLTGSYSPFDVPRSVDNAALRVAVRAAIRVRWDAAGLVKMRSTCAATVFGEIDKAAATCRFVAPSPTSRATAISRAVSNVEGGCGAAVSDNAAREPAEMAGRPRWAAGRDGRPAKMGAPAEMGAPRSSGTCPGRCSADGDPPRSDHAGGAPPDGGVPPPPAAGASPPPVSSAEGSIAIASVAL